ncbi:hypothetical protein [Allofournierella massiliensis]|uniref:Pyridoxamine 5'-phosphate oxidase putative domain-containing protein n=1 Tax=Allofournierella massiliensis TaxID=1650663 RepID=A0ABT7UU40_9FIRM|nr:hypothetical protein [Fournierella massiliensis]MDM8201818.1 hypothetical protein [Fournierella massiliensis]
MKKLAIALLTLTLVFNLCACGQSSSSAASASSAASTSAASSEAASEATSEAASSAASASETAVSADAAATASATTGLYTNLDQAALLEAIGQFKGLCNVSTVNADGTPNIAIFVPGVADDSHIFFNWADNATKANVLREKTAIMSYDIADPTAEEKAGRHSGAVVKLELEEDAEVLAQLQESNESVSEASVVLKIVEVLPVG